MSRAKEREKRAPNHAAISNSIVDNGVPNSKIQDNAISKNKIANAAVTLEKLDPQVALTFLPPGLVMPFAGVTIPAGWLLCDGSRVSRTQFAQLYSALQEKWGAGDGSSTFNLPDLQGRAVVGAGSGANLTPRTLGQSFGNETHVLSIAEMPSHGHDIDEKPHTHGGTWAQDHGLTGGLTYGVYGAGPINSIGSAAGYLTQATIPPASTGIIVLPNGGNQPHPTMPPSSVMNYIIKT